MDESGSSGGADGAEHAAARLFVEADLEAGASIGIEPAQAHYLRHVLRLRSGAAVALFNGRHGEWRATIDGLGKGWGSLAVAERTRPQTVEPDLWLLFAPLKRTRLDFLIQKAVELGVSVLWPVLTEHTDVARVNVERHRANVIEAAEQCERLTVPEIRPPARLGEALAAFPEGRRLAVCVERDAAMPVHDVFVRRDVESEWAILSGPEGGFTQSELDAFGILPFITRVSLGPRILRAETAAIAAISCWQAALGDWQRRPPRRGG